FRYVNHPGRGPMTLMHRKRTTVGTERTNRTGKKVRIVTFATVNEFKGMMSGTLIPLGLKFTVKPGFLNGSGVNGTAAREESKNDRETLKSVNTVRYLSHKSRVNDP